MVARGQTLVIALLRTPSSPVKEREGERGGRERKRERGRESRMTDHGQTLALDIALPGVTE